METRKASTAVFICLERMDEFHWYVANLAGIQPVRNEPLIMTQVGKQV